MIQLLLSFLIIIQYVSTKRTLLQPQFVPIQPNPSNPVLPAIPPPMPIVQGYLGYYNQICMAPQPDFVCQSSIPPGVSLSDGGSQKIECGVDYSCCLCRSISCGSPLQSNCDVVSINGNYGAYGVADINIYGLADSGAFLDCNGRFSCAQTQINGLNMNTVGCTADHSCSGSIMYLENSRGLVCGQEACIGATFVMNSNNEGDIQCAGREACFGTNIDIEGVRHVSCNGNSACKEAIIKVTNPLNGFTLICNGDFSCDSLKLELYIPEPDGGCLGGGIVLKWKDWKGINCGSPEACKNMQLTVVNNGCTPVRIEDLECSANKACVGAVFNLEAGTGPFAQWVELTNCKCSTVSCQQATGIDRCYNNLREMSCPDPISCVYFQKIISNPANGFRLYCPASQSCFGMELSIIVSGGSQNLIQTMRGIHCHGIQSCYGATIYYTNTQINHLGSPVIINVDSIECPTSYSCNDMTVITGSNVNIAKVVCGPLNGAAIGDECINCFIKQYQTDITGIPCDQYNALIAAPAA